MAYIICEPCVDVKDTACVDVCPVDCIHTVDGENQLYINPDECIDCAACEPACPVNAIFMHDEVPAEWDSYIEINEKFFETFVKPDAGGDAAGGADGDGKKTEKRQGIPEEFVQLPDLPASSIRPILGLFVTLTQPVLGAFSAKFKSELEEIVGNSRTFSAAVSTGINCLINLTLYPVLLFLFAVKGRGIGLFSAESNLAIFVGVVFAVVEGLYRFKDDLVSTESEEQPKYRAAFYGWIPSFIAQACLSVFKSTIVSQPRAPRSSVPGAVLTDGPIYSDDLRERYRRYGMVNQIREASDYYQIEIEFPRWVPDSVYKKQFDLPDRMPDYTYQIHLGDDALTVEAKLEDPRFSQVLGRASSFPDGFRNTFQIEGKPNDYRADLRDKVLEIIVPKTGKAADLLIEQPVHYAKLKG